MTTTHRGDHGSTGSSKPNILLIVSDQERQRDWIPNRVDLPALANGELSTGAQTIGKLLRNEGYYTAYKGKWHLAPVAFPDMDAYGFSDWEGNDKAFWGQAGSGVEFDEPIARSAANWIDGRARTEVREWYHRLLAAEAAEFGPGQPA